MGGSSSRPIARVYYTTQPIPFAGNVIEKTTQFNRSPVSIPDLTIVANKYSFTLEITGSKYTFQGEFKTESEEYVSDPIADHMFQIYGQGKAVLWDAFKENGTLKRQMPYSFILFRPLTVTDQTWFDQMIMQFGEGSYGSGYINLRLYNKATGVQSMVSAKDPISAERQMLLSVSNITKTCFQPDPLLPSVCASNRAQIAEIADIQDQIIASRTTLSTQAGPLEDVQKKLADATPKLQDCQTQRQALIALLADLRDRLKQSQQKQQELHSSIDKQRVDNNAEVAKSTALAADLKTYGTQLATLTNQAQTLGSSVDTQSSALMATKNTIDQQIALLQQNKSETETIQSQLDYIQSILAQIPAGSDVSNLIAQTQKLLDSALQQQQAVDKDIKNIRASITSFQSDAEAKKSLALVVSQVSDSQQKIVQTQALIAELQKQTIQHIYAHFGSKGDMLLIVLALVVIGVLIYAVAKGRKKEPFAEKQGRESQRRQ